MQPDITDVKKAANAAFYHFRFIVLCLQRQHNYSASIVADSSPRKLICNACKKLRST